LHRPFLPFGPPDLLLEVILGETAKVVTKGQRVLPVRAEELDYRFLHPDLDEALKAAFAEEKGDPTSKPAEPGVEAMSH
jgi:NAD dependent epimerase/dehydratase family enzyme